MAEIVMPRLSDSMEEGTIITWMKQVGDEIAVGDEIVEIETDKANMAYESDVAGTLTEILAEEGATLPIGEPIARVGDAKDGGARSAGPVAAGDPPPPAVAKASSGVGPPTAPPVGDSSPADEVGPSEVESAAQVVEPESETTVELEPSEVEPVEEEPAEEAVPEPEPEPEPVAAATGPIDLSAINRAWPAVMQKLAEKAPALVATFDGARPVAFDEEGLRIGFPADSAFNKKKAESPDRREAVAAAFESVLGVSMRPNYVTLDEDDGGAGEDAPAEPEETANDEDEMLERLKSEFDAEEVS